MKASKKPSIENFLSQVEQHVCFHEAHPEIRKELTQHLQDKIQENTDAGMSEQAAAEVAIQSMGDPEEIGQRLNQVHWPQVPWLFVAIASGMLALGLFNVYEFQRLGSHSVNIGIGLLVGALLFFIKPGRLIKASPFIYGGALALLTAAVAFGEKYQGLPYVHFLCFNIDAISFSLVPLLISFCGLMSGGKNVGSMKGALKILLSLLPVVFYSILGSPYSAILFAVASLAIFVAVEVRPVGILSAAMLFALSIGLSMNSEKFLSAEAFQNAKMAEAHTDFVISHFSQISVWLVVVGLFLSFALISQLASMLGEVRNKFAKSMIAGHLAILSLAIMWSILANFGYVGMPGSGAPLPFVSYGGSFLIGQLALLGMSSGLYRRKTLTLN